jgi:ornithine cyclodeaminase/alanine dehydrogenase-like protein (mu-crystallin family)
MTVIRILTAADVAAVLSMAPVRTQWSTQSGTALVMPAYLPDDHGLGAKIVSVFPGNPGRGLPTVTALVTLLDADTGLPIAMIDGSYLTALRTGAASGVAIDLLAQPDAHTMALFGAGVQARTQLVAACAVRDIQTVWVYDSNPARSRELIAELAGQGRTPTDLRVASSPAEALAEAQIISTATTSSTPVFLDDNVRPGTHINAIGSFTPNMQEVPGETVARARVFVDQRDAALAEAGDLILPVEQGRFDPAQIIEIGAVINGQAAGRQSPEQITLFESVGNAVQDIATAVQALRMAEARGLGITVTL